MLPRPCQFEGQLHPQQAIRSRAEGFFDPECHLWSQSGFSVEQVRQVATLTFRTSAALDAEAEGFDDFGPEEIALVGGFFIGIIRLLVIVRSISLAVFVSSL